LERCDRDRSGVGREKVIAALALLERIKPSRQNCWLSASELALPKPVRQQSTHLLSICGADQATAECPFLAIAAVSTIALERQDCPNFSLSLCRPIFRKASGHIWEH
jgi:hypothetical protein